jgi:hypothetical protein
MTDLALSVFGDIERFMAELYDYRYPLTVVFLILAAVGLFAAYRVGLHRLLWRHRLVSGVIGTPLLVLALVGGNYFLSPLWERSFLEEDSPIAAGLLPADQGARETSGGQSFEARVVLRGEVMGADSFHFGRGQALVIETAPGQYVLRFEDLSVRNGPDLFIYVSPNPNGFDSQAVNLGELKATDGSFNYEIPPGTTLAQIKSAVVWCKQFSVLFATATLTPS